MKDENEVIQEFNEYVNMTASELDKWLGSDDSQSAGWEKEGESGESVGHDSGRRIVKILKDNPKKDPKKYTQEQIEHMRKVVAYCKRHLSQERKMMDEKSDAQVKKTKAYASLKNWGHDPLKTSSDNNDGDGDEGDEPKDDTEEVDDQADGDDDDAEDGEDNEAEDDSDGDAEDDGQDGAENDADEGEEEKQTGEKRKTRSSQNGRAKKRETKKGQGSGSGTSKANAKGDSNGGGDEEEEEEDQQSSKKGGQPKKGPSRGDTVSWNWGNGQPEGKVLDVKGEKTSVTTKRGNEVSRDGDPEDPAVVLDTGKSKAIKSNHELNET